MDNDYLKRLRALSIQRNTPIKSTEPKVPFAPQAQPQPKPQVNIPQMYQGPRPSTFAPPVKKPTVGPKYSSPFSAISDVFNANSPQDIAKRQAAGQPASYREQQIAMGNTRPDQNIGQALFREPLTLGATQQALSRIGLIQGPKYIAAKLTGNKEAERNVLRDIEKETQREVLGISPIFGQKDLGEKQDLGQAGKRLVGAALGTAGFAVGGGALPTITKFAGKQGVKQLTKFLATEISAGAAGGVGSVLTRNPEASAQELATAGAVGGVLGGGAALGIGALTRSAANAFRGPAGRTLVNTFADTTDTKLIRESLDDLLPNASKEELDALASRLSKTTNPVEVENILQDAVVRTNETALVETPTVREEPTVPVTQPTPAPKTPAITIQEVRNLLEGLPETSKSQFAVEISRANTPEKLQALTERINQAKQAVTQAVEQQVPENLPVSPAQRQAVALTEATQQPTAPIRAELPPAPETVIPAGPRAVTEATTPTTVQGATTPRGIEPQATTQGISGFIDTLNNNKSLYNSPFDPRQFLLLNESGDPIASVMLRKTNDNSVRIDMINAIGEARQGSGTKILDAVIKAADDSGITLSLNPSPDLNFRPGGAVGETMNAERLASWYRSKGFVENPNVQGDLIYVGKKPQAEIPTAPTSRFAITETPEQTMARLRARQAEAPIDQSRVPAGDIAERAALDARQEFIRLGTTDFVERLATQTGISPKWLRRAVDKGYGKDWVYTAALDSVKGADDVNKVFNNRVKNIQIGRLPAGKNLSPLINKEVMLKDGTIARVLDTNANNTRIQVELPDGSVRVDVSKADLMPKGVITDTTPDPVKQAIPEVSSIGPDVPPTVKVNGNIVNTQTGEVLPQSQVLVDRITSAPSAKDATVNDFPSVIELKDSLVDYFNQLENIFGAEKIQNFNEEMVLVGRKEIGLDEITPSTREILEYTTPVTDALFAKSKRVEGLETPELGYISGYAPMTRASLEGPEPINFGYSTIDKANTVFGSAFKRENLLEAEELAPIGERFENYVNQWVYDNYNPIAVADLPEYKNQFTNPVTYLNEQEKIIQNIAAKADDQVADLTKAPVDTGTTTIDAITENWQKHALPEVKQAETINVDSKMPLGASVLDDREILNSVGIYDSFGFKAYDEAAPVGAKIFEDNFSDIANLNKQQIEDRLVELYSDRFPEMPQSAYYVIRKRANKIFNELDNSRKNFEFGLVEEPGVSMYHFQNLEQDLAAAKIFHSIERANISDPRVKKLVDNQLERVITGNRRKQRMYEKVLNELSATLHTAMLGLKLPTALQNLTETSRLIGVLDGDVLKELGQEIATGKLNVKGQLQKFAQDKSVLKQLGDIPANEKRIGVTDLLNKARNGAMFGFDATEAAKDAIMIRGFELQGIKKGLSGKELGQYMAQNYNRYAFKGGQFGSLGFNKNPIGRLMFQFSQYPIKTIKLNSKYAKQLFSADPIAQREAARYLYRTFGTNAIAYAALYPIFGWGLQRALGADLPKFGPVVSLTVELYNIINDEQDRVNRLAEEGKSEPFNWDNVIQRWGRKVSAYPIPGGDFLFNKLGVGEYLPDGYNPFSKNTTIATWQRGYEENYKGNARIAAPDGWSDWYDYALQAVGGQYNTSAARGYFGTTPYSFTLDLPGTSADIRIGSKERLRPLNKNEQRYFETLSKEDKGKFLEQKHKSTRLYQELIKDLEKKHGSNAKTLLDTAIYGNRDLDTMESRIDKNRILYNNPDILAAANLFAAESPLPIKDPFLDLIPEHQKEYLRYQSLSNYDPQRKAMLKINPWILDFTKSREPFFNQFKDPNDKSEDPEVVGYNEPELTDQIKALRDKYFKLEGYDARTQYLADNPSLDKYLKDKDTYNRNYAIVNNYLVNDPYPQADAETQQYLDEYNAAGPKASEGRKAVERSAWIKANPQKWEKVQQYFMNSAMWSLQNELQLAAFEGIEPTEDAYKDITNIAKSLGLGTFGFGGKKEVTAEDLAYRNMLSNLQLVTASNIGLKELAAPKRRRAKFKVSVPSSRRTKRIQLR